MAYFIVSETIKNTWSLLSPVKIDLRSMEGQDELQDLKDENELVKEVEFTNISVRQYALVGGRLFWVNKEATLKLKVLKRAIESKMSPDTLEKLLETPKYRRRKDFLEEIISEA